MITSTCSIHVDVCYWKGIYFHFLTTIVLAQNQIWRKTFSGNNGGLFEYVIEFSSMLSFDSNEVILNIIVHWHFLTLIDNQATIMSYFRLHFSWSWLTCVLFGFSFILNGWFWIKVQSNKGYYVNYCITMNISSKANCNQILWF